MTQTILSVAIGALVGLAISAATTLISSIYERKRTARLDERRRAELVTRASLKAAAAVAAAFDDDAYARFFACRRALRDAESRVRIAYERWDAHCGRGDVVSAVIENGVRVAECELDDARANAKLALQTLTAKFLNEKERAEK